MEKVWFNFAYCTTTESESSHNTYIESNHNTIFLIDSNWFDRTGKLNFI